MKIEALVAPLRADVVSGASVVARKAADVVRRVAEEAPREGLPAFRRTLAAAAVGILDAQPAMAPLVSLTSRALQKARESDDEEGARSAVRDEAARFGESLEAASTTVAEGTLELLPTRGRILTLSASSTVRAALMKAADEREVEVVCLESRPVSEGRRQARLLAENGVAVLYAVDAAASVLVPECDQVLLGADSVGDHGVVNKVGSVATALAARYAGIPVHVLADRSKLLPPGFPQPIRDDRPGDEVWRSPPGIRVWNRYFEHLPLELVDTVVTEDGPLAPREVEVRRREIDVPPELRTWARKAAG